MVAPARSLASGRAQRQRGAATLIVALVLFFSLALIVALASRSLVFEQRASANQARSILAFEAAEAGLEWATAQLNGTARVGDDCLPSSDASARSFRDRYLQFDAATRHQMPRTWLHAGGHLPLQPTCRQTSAGWTCSCPTSGHASLPGPTDDAVWPAFTVRFAASDRPGLVTLVSQGCTQLGGACLPGDGASRADATARTEVTLALAGGLRTPPAAPLTTRGDVTAPRIGARNTDATSGGLALHAGGRVPAGLRLTTLAGSPSSQALVAEDTSLQALPTERFFSRHFGLDKATWRSQGSATPLDCASACTALPGAEAGVDDEGHAVMFHVQGDLHLDGPMALGSAQRPVLVVVDGEVRFRGAMAVHGLVYARRLQWDDSPSGAALHGAALLEGDLGGNGAPQFIHDPAVLDRLTWHAGSFVRVPGSWKDFP